jgi:4-hydroxy-tetrahydrodipicolinate synthase
MSRKGSDFAGLAVAIVTPFRDGKLDMDRLKEQVEFQIQSGTNCLVPCGTTGESPTLSHPEHERVISDNPDRRRPYQSDGWNGLQQHR